MCRGVPIFRETTDACDVQMLIRFNPDDHAGITITDSTSGVRVVSLNKNDVAYAHGLRRDDIILQVNNLPCITHQETIRVWDAVSLHATKTNTPQTLACTLRPQKRTHKFRLFRRELNLSLW